MKLIYLAYRNMVSKPLNLLLSILLLLLSVALVTFSLQVSQQLQGQLNKNIEPFDMVVGAKGSPLQLVLSSVLHIDNPTGNIKLKETTVLQKHPFVGTTVPVSYGDNYKGYRILGTTTDYLTHYNAEISEGKLYKKSFEVVAGSSAAQRLNLKIGDTFVGSHGLTDASFDAHDEHPYVVVGILKPTGTVVDQLLITNLKSIWESHDHGDHEHEDEDHDHEHGNEDHDHEHGEDHKHEHGDEDHDHEHGEDHKHEHGDEDHDHEHGEDHKHEDEDHDHEHGENHKHEHGDEDHDHKHDHGHEHEDEDNADKEITSLLVKFKNPLGPAQLPRFINENTNMQAALPGFEVQRLTGLLGSGVQTINGIALAIFLVSALSIFISLLKTIRERKQELALLRTYGLRTGQLLWLALLEGIFLSFIGSVLGWLLGRLGVWGVSQYMKATYGYGLQISGPELTELLLLSIILALAIVASLLASLSIFKLNVAKTLSDV
jgi:putative ABC transport system permease protein